MLGERPRTAEELNAELYENVSTEFEEYKSNLLMMSPEQILEHACAIRSGIVVALEYHELHARRARQRTICFSSLTTDERLLLISNLSILVLEIMMEAR